MQNVTLGKLASPHKRRDAIHIAVYPAQAQQNLAPGAEVILDSNMQHCAWYAGYGENPIGIVDPFLKEHVQKGEWFYILLNPDSITSLHHDWTHPDILDSGVVESVVSYGDPFSPWRTEEALAMIECLAEGDATATTPLIDYLLDKDFKNEEVLSVLRSGVVSEETWWVIGMFRGGEYIEAIHSIEGVADHMEITWKRIMRGAAEYLEFGEYVIVDENVAHDFSTIQESNNFWEA